MAVSVRIPENVLAILSRSIVDGELIRLPEQLDSATYQKVNGILLDMGGKWTRSLKGHLFDDDPTDRLESVLNTGQIDAPRKNGYFPTPAKVMEKTIKSGAEFGGGVDEKGMPTTTKEQWEARQR